MHARPTPPDMMEEIKDLLTTAFAPFISTFGMEAFVLLLVLLVPLVLWSLISPDDKTCEDCGIVQGAGPSACRLCSAAPSPPSR